MLVACQEMLTVAARSSRRQSVRVCFVVVSRVVCLVAIPVPSALSLVPPPSLPGRRRTAQVSLPGGGLGGLRSILMEGPLQYPVQGGREG
jgi:hypothetical protein